MTVSAQTPINRSTGNGVTTVFPYTFKIISAADIEVSIDDVVKTLNVDYTVTGAGDDTGGNVTMSTAPASGVTVVRRRNMAIVRTIDYQDQGTLPAATLDLDIDATVLIAQQLQEQIDRAIKLPISSPADTESLTADLIRVSESADNVDVVADHIGNIDTVAPHVANVDIAAQNVADINNFADVYQGAHAGDPTTRTNGNALSAGDLYFNTSDNRMRSYSGSGWVDYEATASAAATTATTQAGIATTGAATATTESGTATTARIAAEAARDAAIIGAGVYTTEALGRAAVADGVAFKVQGSGDVAAYEYRRTNSTTSVLIATYPASAAMVNVPSEFETLDPAMNAAGSTVVIDAARNILAAFPDKVSARTDEFETLNVLGEIPYVDAASKVLAYLQTRQSVALTLAPVTTQLNHGLTPYGDVLGPYANSWSIRDTRMRLRKLAAGDGGTGSSQQYNIAFIGDSYTQGGFFTDVVAKALQTQYGFAGSGWTGFGGWFAGTGPWTAINQPTGINGNIRPDLVPIVEVYGNWVTSSAGANNTPSLESAASSTAGDYVRFTKSSGSTVATLYYCGDGTGVVQVSWDDGATYGANVTLSTVGAAHVDLTGTPSGAVTARIKVISGNVKLAGVNQWSYSAGVIVHKLGWSGSAVSNWTAADATLWANQLSALGCNAHVIMFGTNDQGQVTPDVFAANLAVLATRIRSILPYGDLMIAMPPENNRTSNTYPMTQFAKAAREYAVPNDIAFLDLQYFFGSPDSNGAAYAATNPNRPWYGGDLVHPAVATGGRVIADAVLRLLTQI